MNGFITERGRAGCRNGQAAAARAKRERTHRMVLAAVGRRGTGGTTTAGVMIATGLSKSTIRRALGALIDTGQVGTVRDNFDSRVTRYYLIEKSVGT